MIKRSAIAIFLYTERHPFRVFFCVSLILSGWSAFADNVVNNDGILYLSAASAFLEGRWQEAFAIYKWPAYSLTISVVMGTTGLGPYSASQIVNCLFDATAAMIFIAIIRLMGASPRGLIAAGAMITCHLWVNEMRAMVVRDHGYLTLYLLGSYFFLKDRISPHYKLKLACAAAFLAAAFFRAEGLIVFVLAPIYFWFSQTQSRVQKSLAIAAALIIVISLPVGTAFWKSGFIGYFFTAVTEWRLEAFSEFFAGLGASLGLSNIARSVDLLGNEVLIESSKKYAWIAYFGVVVALTLNGIIASVTLVYGPMAIYAMRVKRIIPKPELIGPLLWLVAIQFILLLVFVFGSLFSDWRFGTALSLTLTLPATFALIKAYQFWWTSKPDKKYPNILVPSVLITLVIALAIDGLPQISRDRYVLSAAEWIQENIDPQQTLISNNKALMYYTVPWDQYSGPRQSYDMDPSTFYWVINEPAPTHSLADFDYVAIDIKHNRQNTAKLVLENLDARVLMTFHNNWGDQLTILEVEKN